MSPDNPQRSPWTYHRLRLSLAFLSLLRWVRRGFDAVGIGSTTLARFCCALLFSIVPFLVCLVLASVFDLERSFAVAVSLVVGGLFLVPSIILVAWPNDDVIEDYRDLLTAELPGAKLALDQHRTAKAADKAAKRAADSEAAMKKAALQPIKPDRPKRKPEQELILDQEMPLVPSHGLPDRPIIVVQHQRQQGFQCPFCGSNRSPLRKSKISVGGWLAFWMLLLFCCWPLCWIGLLMTESYTLCRDCRVKLG